MTTLNKDACKQLEKLSRAWETPEKSRLGFGPAELRLLLEHYRPLQELIRTIAGAAHQPDLHEQPPLEALALRAALEDARRELNIQQQRYQALEQELAKCKAIASRLEQENIAQRQLNQELTEQLQQAQAELSSRDEQLARATHGPAELALLRQDVELSRKLELTELPADNIQALTQVVAVLAQPDNLERLWNALKERCEAENRAANQAERALFAQALNWHNHNWRSKPYRLIEVTGGTSYNYEHHLRSRDTPTGEILAEQLLSGFTDGGGRVRCKALVKTR